MSAMECPAVLLLIVQIRLEVFSATAQAVFKEMVSIAQVIVVFSYADFIHSTHTATR